MTLFGEFSQFCACCRRHGVACAGDTSAVNSRTRAHGPCARPRYDDAAAVRAPRWLPGDARGSFRSYSHAKRGASPLRGCLKTVRFGRVAWSWS